MTNSDDNAATIIDMLREQTRLAEARNDTRHAEVMGAVKEMKTAFETHEEKDDARFEDINRWRWKLVGGGIVSMGLLSFAAPVAAQMLGVGQ